MTNQIAIILGLILSGIFAYDLIANDTAMLIFLGQQLIRVVHYLAFWR